MKPTREEAYNAALDEVRNKPYTRPNKYIKYYMGSNTTQKPSWCGMFVYYVLVKKLGAKYLIDGCSNIAYVPSIYNWAKKYNKITKTPAKGDLVIFDWEKNTKLDCDHVGFFVKDLGNGYIQTIEGNTSNSSNGDGNCVQVRKRSISWVACYVSLDYEGTTQPKKVTVKKSESTTATKTAYSKDFPTAAVSIKSGTKANKKLWQEYLNWYGNYNLTVDGVFGDKTLEATKKFQKENGLTDDGIVGTKTIAKAKEIKK